MYFYPQNNTSVIQPLDQGVIQAFKAHYCRQHLRFVFNELDDGKELEKIKVDLRQVSLRSRGAREFIHGETIAACWNHARILPLALQAEPHNYLFVAKAKGKLKECFEELVDLFKKVKLDENPKEMVALDVEDVLDNRAGGYQAHLSTRRKESSSKSV